MRGQAPCEAKPLELSTGPEVLDPTLGPARMSAGGYVTRTISVSYRVGREADQARAALAASAVILGKEPSTKGEESLRPCSLTKLNANKIMIAGRRETLGIMVRQQAKVDPAIRLELEKAMLVKEARQGLPLPNTLT